MDKKNAWQFIKFALFSASAGIIQIGSYAILYSALGLKHWISYIISLALSVIWNFTFNKRYTFKSAANVGVAMTKVFAFYVVFAPLSTYLGHLAEEAGVNGYIIEIVTMLSNFILEFLYCKFYVYKNQENTLEEKK